MNKINEININILVMFINHKFNYVSLPNSSGPTHFEAIELVTDKAAPRNTSNGGTVKSQYNYISNYK